MVILLSCTKKREYELPKNLFHYLMLIIILLSLNPS